MVTVGTLSWAPTKLGSTLSINFFCRTDPIRQPRVGIIWCCLPFPRACQMRMRT